MAAPFKNEIAHGMARDRPPRYRFQGLVKLTRLDKREDILF